MSTTTALEPAREHIDSSGKQLKISFDKFVKIVTTSLLTKKKERRSAVLALHNDESAIIKLIDETHGLVQGKTIKRRLTALRKTLVSSSDEDSEDTATDTQVSELESSSES